LQTLLANILLRLIETVRLPKGRKAELGRTGQDCSSSPRRSGVASASGVFSGSVQKGVSQKKRVASRPLGNRSRANASKFSPCR